MVLNGGLMKYFYHLALFVFLITSSNPVYLFAQAQHSVVRLSQKYYIPTERPPGALQKDFVRGADTSGGGAYRIVENRAPVLLDFAIYTNHFVDNYENSEDSHIELKKHAFILGYQTVGNEYFENMPIYSQLKERLEIWRSNSPATVSLIETALKSIDWKLTPHKVASFYEEDDVVGGVFYHKEGGAYLSVPLWNQTGNLSRVGMLIHEAFRHAKLMYDSETSDSNIQFLTAKISLDLPANGESLDRHILFEKNSSVYQYFASKVILDKVELQLVTKLKSIRNISIVQGSSSDRKAIDQLLSNISSKSAYQFIDKMSKELEDLSSSEELDYYRRLSIREAFHYTDQVIGHSIKKATLKYKDAIRQLDTTSFNVAKLVGEKVLAEYIDSGVNPYSSNQFEERARLDSTIEALKKLQQQMVDAKLIL